MSEDLLADACEGYTAGIGSLADEDGGILRRGAVLGCFSGLPAPPLNAIHAWVDHPEVERDIRALVAHGEERGLPMAVCFPEGASHQDRVLQVGSDLAFTEVEEPQAAMVLVDGDAPPLPADLVPSSPTDAADLAVIARLMSEAFGMPEDLARAAGDRAALDRSDVEWVTLWLGDEPVATSMLLLAGEVANVFNVAVPVRHRRRGFGAAATWEVVRRGRERGARRTALVASHMGEPVYSGMGFEVVGHVRTLMRA